MARGKYSMGVLLIAIAVVLLLGKLGVITFLGALFWPVLILVPGLLLHFLYFRRALPSGVLVPGGMLVTYSLMFFYCNLFGWGSMGYLWPGFLFGLAVGLYELYLFERQTDRTLFTAALVLAILSAVFFGFAFLFTAGIYFIAFVLILIGAVLVIRRPKAW